MVSPAPRKITNLTPYGRGVVLSIQRHIAPRPFGNGYGPSPRPIPKIPPSGRLPDRVAFALENPPIETNSPLSSEQEQHNFTITGTKTLREFGGEGSGGAHVVTGYLNQDRAQQYVAKIYDGVYYPLVDQESGEDCMLLADADYAVEYWAYETMQSVETVSCKLVPGCYGGWTFALPARRRGRRWVRMLLLELVNGETMLAKVKRAIKNDRLDYSLLPPESFRLAVLKNLFEADIKIWWDAEVSHMDQNPRNIIVHNDGRVVLVDFNMAYVYRFVSWDQHPKHESGAPSLPVSPIERYWPFAPGGTNLAEPEYHDNPWGNWIPQSWLESPELAAEWVLETWKDASPSRYRPLSDYFLNHWNHKERSPKVLAILEELGRKPAARE